MHTHTCTRLGGGRKPENLNETHMDIGRTCKTLLKINQGRRMLRVAAVYLTNSVAASRLSSTCRKQGIFHIYRVDCEVEGEHGPWASQWLPGSSSPLPLLLGESGSRVSTSAPMFLHSLAALRDSRWTESLHLADLPLHPPPAPHPSPPHPPDSGQAAALGPPWPLPWTGADLGKCQFLLCPSVSVETSSDGHAHSTWLASRAHNTPGGVTWIIT